MNRMENGLRCMDMSILKLDHTLAIIRDIYWNPCWKHSHKHPHEFRRESLSGSTCAEFYNNEIASG